MLAFPKQSVPIALILAVAASAWMLAPELPTERAGGSGSEGWEMPKLQLREPGKWAAAIDKHHLWGVTSGDKAVDAQKRSGMRFSGVVIHGAEVFAMIGVDDKPSERYRVGDIIPNGAKILKIEEGRLHLWTNGAGSVLEIYRK